jgi:hypothetical protein
MGCYLNFPYRPGLKPGAIRRYLYLKFLNYSHILKNILPDMDFNL